MLSRFPFFIHHCLFVLMISITLNSIGQGNVSKGLYFQTKGGFLMAHRSTMAHLVRNNTFGFEVGIIKHKQSPKDAYYAFPALGVNLEYRNFGYNDVLGQAISLSHFFDTPIYQSRNFFVDFQYGMGLGFITKKYHIDSNPTNIAIGSNFNAKVTLKIMATKYFRDFNLGAGIELTHFSNGAITYPNLGLNVPSLIVQLGFLNRTRARFDPTITYSYGGCLRQGPIYKTLHFSGSNLSVSSFMTLKQVRANPNLPKRYPVMGVKASYHYNMNCNWSAEFGFDLLYNESNLHLYTDSTFKRGDVMQVGVFAGAYYRFYKSEVIINLGFYLRDKINPLGRVYNKIGYRYYVSDNWYGLFNVRANLGKADFFEFGIGFRTRRW